MSDRFMWMKIWMDWGLGDGHECSIYTGQVAGTTLHEDDLRFIEEACRDMPTNCGEGEIIVRDVKRWRDSRRLGTLIS